MAPSLYSGNVAQSYSTDYNNSLEKLFLASYTNFDYTYTKL